MGERRETCGEKKDMYWEAGKRDGRYGTAPPGGESLDGKDKVQATDTAACGRSRVEIAGAHGDGRQRLPSQRAEGWGGKGEIRRGGGVRSGVGLGQERPVCGVQRRGEAVGQEGGRGQGTGSDGWRNKRYCIGKRREEKNYGLHTTLKGVLTVAPLS